MKFNLRTRSIMALSVFCSTLSFATFAKDSEKPNFIIFYTDDQGYGDTSVPMMKDRPFGQRCL